MSVCPERERDGSQRYRKIGENIHEIKYLYVKNVHKSVPWKEAAGLLPGESSRRERGSQFLYKVWWWWWLGDEEEGWPTATRRPSAINMR